MTEKSVEVIIRKIESGDYKELARFFGENNAAEIVRQFNPFPLNDKTARHIACEDHLDRYYIALSGDRIIGMCMLRGMDEGYQRPGFGILIDRRFRNSGLGKKMTQFSVAQAKELGYLQLRLTVYASNAVAMHLYDAFGFIEVERERVEVMGQVDEKIIMLKDL